MIEDTYKKKKRAAWRISIYLVSPSEGQIPEFYERRRALLVHIGRLCTLSRKIAQKHSTTKSWSYIKRVSVCNESLRVGKDRQEGQLLIMKSLCEYMTVNIWILTHSQRSYGDQSNTKRPNILQALPPCSTNSKQSSPCHSFGIQGFGEPVL